MLDHATNESVEFAPATASDGLPPPNSHTITYQTLLERYAAESTQRGDRSVSVHLRKWLSRWKKELADPIGSELHFEFDRCFAAFRTTLERTEKTDKSAHNAASVIKSLHRTYVAWLEGTDLPSDFAGALRKAMALAGVSQRELIRNYKADYNLSLPQLNKWLKGRSTPNYKRTQRVGRAVIERLEKLLKLKPGALSERAFANAPRVLLEPNKTRNAYRDHHSMLVNDKGLFPSYMLRPLPPHIEKHFATLTAWRKKDKHHTPENPAKRYTSVPKKHLWNSSKTIGLYRNEFESFFGFLCAPTSIVVPAELPTALGGTAEERATRYLKMRTGLGMKPEDLRFTMLVDHELVDRYVEFRKARNLLEGTTLNVNGQVLHHISLLANKEIAFFRRHPAFGAELSPPVEKAGWSEWCDTQYRGLRDLANALRSTILKVRTREPDEPVRHVFAQKDPAQVLIDLGQHLLNTLPPKSCPVFRALQYRNATLLLLMCYEPLRAGHWLSLEIGKNIYEDESSGIWVLDIKAEEFKNAIWGYAQDRYRKLPPALGAIVQTYIMAHRPLLYMAADTNIFLLKSRPATGKAEPGPALSENGFYKLVSSMLEKYLGTRVGPHVIRHILTTDYLRKHPGDYETAAALLNDSPDTVRINYSHVKQTDLLARHDEERDSAFKNLK